MKTEHKVSLDSAELASLWTSYINGTLTDSLSSGICRGWCKYND